MQSERYGGGSGIRTHGDIAASPVFKTGALNRSAIPPNLEIIEPSGSGGAGSVSAVAQLARICAAHLRL
jgi:hypothetical protein